MDAVNDADTSGNAPDNDSNNRSQFLEELHAELATNRAIDPVVPCPLLEARVTIPTTTDQALFRQPPPLPDTTDQFLLRSSTITAEVKNADDLPKLADDLKRLSESDSCTQCYTSESGEHIIVGTGEPHLEIHPKGLKEDHAEVPTKVGDPVVAHHETVQSESSTACLSESLNKELTDQIEDGKIIPHDNPKVRAHELAEEHGWDVTDTHKITPRDDPEVCTYDLAEKDGWDTADAHKIWCFGADTTKAAQHLNEIKDSYIAASQFAAKEGPTAEEPLRGCYGNILDAALHADAIHCSGGQIIPTCRCIIYTSTHTATPSLQESVCLADIQCPESVLDSIYGVLNHCHNHALSEEQRPSTPIYNIRAYLPTAKPFSLVTDLGSNTGSQTFPQGVPDHQFEARKRPDSRNRLMTFEVGDTVLAWFMPTPPKGSPKFADPYKIERITKGGMYVLRAEGALDRGPTRDRDLHEVDFIRTSATDEAGITHYRIHWRGYLADDETWETEEAFQDLSIPTAHRQAHAQATDPAAEN
ncbi:translation elongation factor 2 [Spiromyces aspiralis]|uniref:Translation elongation factor 2 n=1 Tax=Spiromyces aspiralis TaxID=68401 RepID=A0ACC1HJQ4_9FUNG|nr:translation elongation factor 2 [Spiromyces aspiralis]